MTVESIDRNKVDILYHAACTYQDICFLALRNINNFSRGISLSAVLISGMLSMELYIKYLTCDEYLNNNPGSAIASFPKTHSIKVLLDNCPTIRSQLFDYLDKYNIQTKEQ